MSYPTKHLLRTRLRFIVALIFLASLFLGLSSARAGDFLGADGVISLVKKATGSADKQAADPGKEEAKRIMRDLESFKMARAKLPVAEAVERWLKFYDRFRMLPPDALKSQRINPYAPPSADELSMRALISAIPSPAAWDELKAHVLVRQTTDGGNQEVVLRMLVYFLTQDKANLEKAVAEFKTNAALGGNRASSYPLREFRVDMQLQKNAKRTDAIVDTFDAYLQSLKGERPEGRITVQVPDLVTLAGEKRAEELILNATAISGLSLNVPSGGATLELTKRLLLKNIEKITEPQWELVTGIYDVTLYEALDKRFPDKAGKKESSPDIFQSVNKYGYRSTMDDSSRRRAKIFYIMGLIAQNRITEATEKAKGMESADFQNKDFEKSWHSFDKLRFATELNQFCKDLLTNRPELQLWKECGLIAGSGKDSEVLITMIDAAAQKPNIGLESRLGIRERQIELLLAMDRVDDAVSLLHETLMVDAGRETPQVQLAVTRSKLKLASRMFIVGRLLERKELIREGEEVFLSALKDAGQRISITDMSSWNVRGSESPIGMMIDAYWENGDLAGAERMVVAVIQAFLKAPELNAQPAARDWALSSGVLAGHLLRLAEIYDRAGRHEDVLTLLEKAAWWGGVDLIDIADENIALIAITAKALHLAGRDTEAVEMLKSHLLGNPGDDSAYIILTEILGAAAIPWLDTLYLRDRFEERPLIWKAHLLKKNGKLDEAEATIRQALKIDPTDGEQKAGDRGRAYVELVEILKAKGKTEDSAFFERVVTSIRTAERGDKFTEAGLIRKSLAMYEEASKSFADAYCVQWRLAERLSSMGDMEAARKHYEIAFERMPEQFGQVARFCFGCEGVFTHQQSVSIAEEVLTGLAKTAPRKPQVHYLLGQLRESQGRKDEAYRHFRTAAEIDLQYLDALKAAYSLRKDVFLSQTEADEIALRMVRLDPRSRHDNLSADEIDDLKGLWSIYEDIGKEKVNIPKGLLTLTASKQELEALVKKFGVGSEFLEWKRNSYRENRVIPEPGDAVVKNNFIKKLLQVTSQGGMMFE
ncbi:MAG: tetratricopeptide repeat protein [Nitrospirae bacterium]|nr:tetratricopeptide repeat protein [Nitrospirota bacterium]